MLGGDIMTELAVLRKQTGLTQKQIARRIGIFPIKLGSLMKQDLGHQDQLLCKK